MKRQSLVFPRVGLPARVAGACLAVLLACGPARPPGTSPGAGSGSTEKVTLYSGRQEDLVGPIIARFEKETGIDVRVKYGGTADLASLLLEEGDRSRADVFLAQDAGALGAVAKQDAFSPLSPQILERVPPQFRSPASQWVGITGRARTVVFNTEKLSEGDLPSSILDFTDAEWKDRIGWAPTNGSFQAFLTALRQIRGEEEARKWLQGIKANNARSYPANIPIVHAVGRGEIDVGFVNHYYAVQLKREDPRLAAANHFFRNGDPGGLVNVSGAGILKTSGAKEPSARLIGYLLSDEGQRYFANEEFEYPLVPSVNPPEGIPPLEELKPPKVQLSDLDDLKGTLEMLNSVGLT